MFRVMCVVENSLYPVYFRGKTDEPTLDVVQIQGIARSECFRFEHHVGTDDRRLVGRSYFEYALRGEFAALHDRNIRRLRVNPTLK